MWKKCTSKVPKMNFYQIAQFPASPFAPKSNLLRLRVKIGNFPIPEKPDRMITQRVKTGGISLTEVEKARTHSRKSYRASASN